MQSVVIVVATKSHKVAGITIRAGETRKAIRFPKPKPTFMVIVDDCLGIAEEISNLWKIKGEVK